MNKRRIQLISLLIALALFVIQNHDTGTAHAFSRPTQPLEKVKEAIEKIAHSLITSDRK
ncbi:hypothetical protein ACFQ49_12200 [Kroppenstedtia eburnea]|uniref:Uncharacterized protein n=1 Tax=Kroppenstedtia eburnea TaxID=714067 RepID=A0A1N7KP23_9BACL|nr:hypothetical protein [Kroppenstedtia eburnea]QKI82881.1 hypothetical protein GXN75_13230 [Kroppenstedtia eburnea]SIS63353.1 hypothetical protein SAMN05421790_103191 [Kroppenstedtia eburnea]